MSDCKNCKQSILSQTPSLIPGTKCNGDCVEDISCSVILPSKCVFYSGNNLPCLEVNYGDNFTDVISKINSKYYTITSESITITESVVNGCTVLNLEVPAIIPSEDKYVSATVGGVTDVPGYLVDKLDSSDGSITINTVAPEISKVNLTVPCISKTKVSALDETESCGFLIDKFTDSALLPVADYSTVGDPRIKFIKQVRTYSCSPDNTPNVVTCNPSIGQGVLVNPTNPSYSWKIVPGADTMKNVGDITLDNTGKFTVVAGGIYDISINFGIIVDSSAANPGYIRVLLNYFNNTGSGLCLTFGNVYCDLVEQGIYGSCVVKGVSIPSNTEFKVILFNHSGGSTDKREYNNIDLSFEKVG